jgi:hypothetical protein
MNGNETNRKERRTKMKKLVIASIVVAMVVGLSLTFGGPDNKGNGLPKGKSYNFNVIGVPNQKNWDADRRQKNLYIKNRHDSVLRTGRRYL